MCAVPHSQGRGDVHRGSPRILRLQESSGRIQVSDMRVCGVFVCWGGDWGETTCVYVCERVRVRVREIDGPLLLLFV